MSTSALSGVPEVLCIVMILLLGRHRAGRIRGRGSLLVAIASPRLSGRAGRNRR